MKYSTTSAALVALSLAAATPSQAFTAPSSMMRPLPLVERSTATTATTTSMWNSMEPDQDEDKMNLNPTPALFNMFQDASKDKNALVAGVALATALAAAPLPSDAAMSGGRMGGASFSSRPSMSRSYSAPRSSYSGGYSRGYSQGYRPSYISPMMYSPMYSPFGVVSYGGGGGGGLLPLFVLGGLALSVSNALGGISRSSGSFFEERESDSVLGAGTGVVKISVALDVADRDDPTSILGALERLSTTARTDSRMGIQNLSSQVALELLRRKSSISAATTEYQHFRSRDQAQREFNSLSVQERGKFEKESISKFGGVDYSSGESTVTGGFNDKATMAVVTLVLAVDGDSTKVPQIRSMSDVENALRKIASDVRVSDCLQGAEILWTPEDRTETLSFRDVVADYPELTSV